MKKLLSILLIATCAFATVNAQVTEDRKTKDVCPNTEVQISATPKDGYVFMGWSNDPSSVDSRSILENSNGDTYTINPTASVTYYAVWGNKVFYKENQDYSDVVTLNTGITNPVIAETGKTYTIVDNYSKTGCATITGYKVYAATDENGSYNADSNPIATITLSEGTNPTFALNQNVVIVPEVDPGTVTVTIISEDTNMGTVSFVNQNNSGTTSGGSNSGSN